MALHTLAAYKLERSSKLGTLERLIGSQSLGASIATILSLGAFHTLTVPTLVLWAMSPLGGQAAVNLVSIGSAPIPSNSTIPYFSTEGPIGFSTDDLGFQASLDATYSAALYAPAAVRSSPMDLWGNVKIPYLSALSKQGPPSLDGWYDVSNGSLSAEQYSSLLGIPIIANLTDDGNTTFPMLSSYLEFDCNPLQSGVSTVVHNLNGSTPKNGTWYAQTAVTNTFTIAINGSNPEMYGPYIIPAFLENETLAQPAPWGLLFEAGQDGVEGQTQCSILTVYVDSTVSCTGKSCAVTRMRPTTAAHPNPWNTDLACPQTFFQFTGSFLPALGTYPTLVHPGYSGAAEQYMATGELSQSFWNWTLGDVSSTADFSARLGHLMNTYWYGSFAPTAFAGNASQLLPTNTTLLTNAPGEVTQSQVRHASASSVRSELVYQVSRTWMGLFVTATTVMLLAALLNGCILTRTRGPRVLGSVAGLLRGSRHIALPPALHDSTLDAENLARLGSELQLCLADITPHNETGHIAIQLCEPDGPPLGRLARGRPYR